MKIQSLAVLFIILILPISIVLSTYTQSRVATISLQATYDSKLNDATHDALKAYQINSFTSDTSNLTNSKIRDIKASVNTFFNSLGTNFSSLGHTKETLQNYVPALVYTMYDGYYIYSPYTNTWWSTNSEDGDISAEMSEQIKDQYTYSNGGNLYGLKPYVYYSCRYKKGNTDVIVIYSLDNYIQIQGTIKGKTVSQYGYVLNKASSSSSDGVYYDGNNVWYNGILIESEKVLTENVYVDGQLKKDLPYIKNNGTKYYYDGTNVFSVLKGKSLIQNNEELKNEISDNNNARKYYIEAYNFMTFIEENGLYDIIKTENIVDSKTGNKYTNIENPYYSISESIFSGDVEAEDSNFNTHRIDVIKYSIESNLSVAISNFNNYSGVSTDFQMPKLKDSDWDKIMDNISIISFFQGANIGGKVYNGYSIITNTQNEDVVMEDSIYIKTNDNVIHRITENGLTLQNGAVGIFNINLKERSDENGGYYLPVTGILSYDSIVTQNNISPDYNENLNEYLKGLNDDNLKKIYYTALARERYSLYRPQLWIPAK